MLRRRPLWWGIAGLLVAGVLLWCVFPSAQPPEDPEAAWERVQVRTRVQHEATARAPSPAVDSRVSGNWCPTRCDQDPECVLVCSLDHVAASPDDPTAWFQARIAAMMVDDQELYRDLLVASRDVDGGDTPLVHRVRARWGSWMASHLPSVQEDGLSLLSGLELQNSLAGEVLGVGACGIKGPDFVVCVP